MSEHGDDEVDQQQPDVDDNQSEVSEVVDEQNPDGFIALNKSVKLHEYIGTKFSGNKDKQDAEPHMLAFDDYVQALGAVGAPYAQLLSLFKRTVQGKARMWLERHSSSNLKELKDAFLKHFGKVNSPDVDRDLFLKARLQPGVPAQEYLYELRSKASALNYDEAMVQYKFFEGLPASYKQILRTLKHEPVDELLKYVEELQSEEASGGCMLPGSANAAQLTHTTQNIAKGLEDLTKEFKNFKLSISQRLDNNSSQGDNSGYEEFCPDEYSPGAEVSDSYGYYTRNTRGRSRRRGRYTFRDRSYSQGRGYRNSGPSDPSPQSGADYFPRGRNFGHQRWSNPVRSYSGESACDFCGISGHFWKNCRKLREYLRFNDEKDKDFRKGQGS